MEKTGCRSFISQYDYTGSTIDCGSNRTDRIGAAGRSDPGSASSTGSRSSGFGTDGSTDGDPGADRVPSSIGESDTDRDPGSPGDTDPDTDGDPGTNGNSGADSNTNTGTDTANNPDADRDSGSRTADTGNTGSNTGGNTAAYAGSYSDTGSRSTGKQRITDCRTADSDSTTDRRGFSSDNC